MDDDDKDNEESIEFIELDSRILGASEVKALDKDVIYQKFTDDEAFRIESALSNSMFVFPVAPSIYKIHNYKNPNDKTNYSEYRVSFPVSGTEICTCQDFTMSIAPDKVLATRCKHIWRVLFELHVGNIPPIGVCPYKWILNKVERKLLRIAEQSESSINTHTIKTLKGLRFYLLTKDKFTVDYYKAYKTWHNLLENPISE